MCEVGGWVRSGFGGSGSEGRAKAVVVALGFGGSGLPWFGSITATEPEGNIAPWVRWRGRPNQFKGLHLRTLEFGGLGHLQTLEFGGLSELQGSKAKAASETQVLETRFRKRP